ncbi:MAG TPA: hypothetical protein VJT82_04755, partial [Pyrinomonadaceae bacterium]|nr:hypothetical protein [Pyrinomonadaceae bacterium]
MQKISNAPRLVALLLFASVIGLTNASAQNQRDADRNYSDSDAPASRSRTTTRGALGDTPTDILRNARTVFIEQNEHIKADYLEYKLDKLPEFGQWQLSFVKDKEK